jgi:sialate O-acetylesterase
LIEDVYFGDVWLCVGQDNMEMPISDVFNASLEVDAMKNYPLVRLFTFKRAISPQVSVVLSFFSECCVALRCVGGH